MKPLKQSIVGVALSCAEVAWALRDAADAGIGSDEVPRARHMLPAPPTTAESVAETTIDEAQSDLTTTLDARGDQGGGQAAGEQTTTGERIAAGHHSGCSPGQLELQRAFTHVQMSKSWVALGESSREAG